MSAVSDLLREVARYGGVLRVRDGRVFAEAPEPLPDELMERLRDHRGPLICHLSRDLAADWAAYTLHRAELAAEHWDNDAALEPENEEEYS